MDEVKFAKMEKDVEYTKQEVHKIRDKVDTLHDYVVGGEMNNKFAGKYIEKILFWFISIAFSALIGMVGYLLTKVL